MSTNNAANEEGEREVIGRANYKGTNYEVRWVGECEGGEYKARLCTLDGKLDFWAVAARPYSNEAASDDVAFIFKTYPNARPLADIRPERGPAPDPSCYWSGFAWLVKGCPTCKTDGQMCASCAHDVLDN